METGQVNERFHAEKEMVMETLFVIGAGTMGGGIAQVAALNGFTVVSLRYKAGIRSTKV